MAKKKLNKEGKNHVTTQDTKEVKVEKAEELKVESPSDLTESKRLDDLEATILQLKAKLEEKSQPDLSLPRAERPEDIIERVTGEKKPPTSRKENSPKLPETFKEHDVIQIAENCDKYDAYKFDKDGQPVKMIYEYHCQACTRIEEYVKGPKKKLCPDCKSSMLQTATGRYGEGKSAYGVVMHKMYVTKKGYRKYKVYFNKFGDLSPEALTEDEMVKVG